jgi:hypothetical protein
LTANARDATRLLSRGQFEELRRGGRYGDYVEWVARVNGTTADVIRVWGPKVGGRGFRHMVRMRVREIERFRTGAGGAAGAAGVRTTMSVQMAWPEGEMPPKVEGWAGRIIAEAKMWLGTPYSWGGGGPAGPSFGIDQGAGTRGFDCSGFIEYLYAKMGRRVGSYTGTQRNAGRHVRTENGEGLAEGDIVFFGSDYGHVGLYIGGGLFIEAPYTGSVIRITRLRDRPDFVEARRIIG